MNSGTFSILIRFILLIPGSLLFRVAIAQDVYIVNPFVQPNDSTLNWYGSGDANGNDTLTWDDVTRMQELIDGTFSDPDDRRLYDRADVNGDQVVNAQDKVMMEEHLNTEPFFQPKWYWNKLKTRADRELLLEKTLAIDKTDEIPPSQYNQLPLWDCTQYSDQLMINFQGITDLKDIDRLFESYNYDMENNGRFNLPVQQAHIVFYDDNDQPIGGHAMNTIVLGNSSEKWFDWSHVEPQRDLYNVQSGEVYLTWGNIEFRVRSVPSFAVSGYPEARQAVFTNYLMFILKNSIISEPVIYNNLNKKFISNRDTIPPEISLNLVQDSVYESISNISIIIEDNFDTIYQLQNVDYSKDFNYSSWFSYDHGRTKKQFKKTYLENIILAEGNHTIIIYSRDDAYNEIVDSVNITIKDIYAPRINILSPSNRVYSYSPVVDITLEEPNFKTAQYSLDDGLNWNDFCNDTSLTPVLEMGDHTLIVQAEDDNGNTSLDSVSFTIADLDAPSAPTGLIVENITINSFDLFWDPSMDNVGVSGYRVFSGDAEEGTSPSNSYLFQDLSPNTGYSITVSAYDEVGNESAKSSSITVTTVDPTVGIDFNAEFLGQVKIYPNPTHDQLYIETKDILQYSIEISSINGQLVYNQEVAGLIHQIDFSSFQKGVYFITIRSQDFVMTRKIFKF